VVVRPATPIVRGWQVHGKHKFLGNAMLTLYLFSLERRGVYYGSSSYSFSFWCCYDRLSIQIRPFFWKSRSDIDFRINTLAKLLQQTRPLINNKLCTLICIAYLLPLFYSFFNNNPQVLVIVTVHSRPVVVLTN